jgi:tetratricopeptide (TPR) repeat protein
MKHLLLATVATFAVLICTVARADDPASCRAITSDEAVDACTRLIDSAWYKYRPKDLAVAYSNRGAALSTKGDDDKAIEDLNEAVRLDPQLAMAFNNRGLAWQKKKKYDQAIQDFTAALDIDPKLYIALKGRALAWLGKRNFERSLADFDAAIGMNPAPAADDFLGRAMARIERKQYDGAISDLDEAIRMQPQPKAVYFLNRSWAWVLKTNYDRALPDLNEAIRLDPTNAVAFNNRGFVYNGKGQYDRAMTDLNEALRLDPNSASGYKNRGITFEKKGDVEKALRDFRKAASIDPRNKDAADGIKRLGVGPSASPEPATVASRIDSVNQTRRDPPDSFRGIKWNSALPSIRQLRETAMKSCAAIVEQTNSIDSAPCSHMHISTDNMELFAQRQDVPPIFGVPVSEQLLTWSQRKFWMGQIFIYDYSEADSAKLNVALIDQYGQPTFKNDRLHLTKWTWPDKKLEISLSFDPVAKPSLGSNKPRQTSISLLFSQLER